MNKSNVAWQDVGFRGVVINAKEIPKASVDSISRTLLDCVRSYFEDPQIRAEYDNWLEQYKNCPKAGL